MLQNHELIESLRRKGTLTLTQVRTGDIFTDGGIPPGARGYPHINRLNVGGNSPRPDALTTAEIVGPIRKPTFQATSTPPDTDPKH